MNHELYEILDNKQSFTQKYLGFSFVKFLVLILIVLALGVYLGVVLYGTNSLKILFGLQEYESYLQTEINKLKNDNAELQREYFELREISAQ
jgi:hypothetical protein